MDEEIDYVKKIDSHASSLQKHTSRSKVRKTVEAQQEKQSRHSKKNGRSKARKTGQTLLSNIHIQMSRNQICVKLTYKLQCPQKNNKHAAMRESGIYEISTMFGVIYGSVAFHVCFSIFKASNALSLVCKFILKLIISLNFIVAKV